MRRSVMLLVLAMAAATGCTDQDCPSEPQAPVTISVNPEGTGDYPTIQAAIDAAPEAAVIRLEEGTYEGAGNAALDFLGKSLSLESRSGDPRNCIVDCTPADPATYPAVRISTVREPGAVLRGITLRRSGVGNACLLRCSDSECRFEQCVFGPDTMTFAMTSAAIECWHSSVLFEGCIFERGLLYSGASMLDIARCSAATLRSCRFEGNRTSPTGLAVCYLFESNVELDGCTFTGNDASCVWLHACDDSRILRSTFYANNGYALHAQHAVGTILSSCTMGYHGTDGGAALSLSHASSLDVNQCVLAFNQSDVVVGQGEDSSIEARCSDVFGNHGGDWTGPLTQSANRGGNISRDPQFRGGDSGDLHLLPDSPCSADSSACGTMGAWPVAGR